MADYQPTGDDIVRAIVVWLVTALFIHLAAKGVIGRSSFLTAILVAFLGTLLATLVWALVGGTLGLILGFATWALICAVFYRARWLQGAAVGLVAWLLYILVTLAFNWILTQTPQN